MRYRPSHILFTLILLVFPWPTASPDQTATECHDVDTVASLEKVQCSLEVPSSGTHYMVVTARATSTSATLVDLVDRLYGDVGGGLPECQAADGALACTSAPEPVTAPAAVASLQIPCRAYWASDDSIGENGLTDGLTTLEVSCRLTQ